MGLRILEYQIYRVQSPRFADGKSKEDSDFSQDIRNEEHPLLLLLTPRQTLLINHNTLPTKPTGTSGSFSTQQIG